MVPVIFSPLTSKLSEAEGSGQVISRFAELKSQFPVPIVTGFPSTILSAFKEMASGLLARAEK